MRIRGGAALAAALAALVLAGCTTTLESSYQVDFRNLSMPVMLNAPAASVQGRSVPISFEFSSTTTQSSYSTAYSTVTVTTTRTRETSLPFAYQLALNLAPSDGLAYLKDVTLNYHIMMAPYYGENSRSLSAEALIASKEALK